MNKIVLAPDWCECSNMDMDLLKDTSSLLDNINTAILIFNAEMDLFYVNAPAESLLSSSKKNVCGLSVSVIFPEFPLLEAMQTALETGQPFSEKEVEIKMGNDQSLLVDCSIRPINETANPNGVILECFNVDSHHRMAREDSMIARHEATSAILRGMAHEIKNPLGGLRGAAQLLEMELRDNELKEYTQIIITEADRLRTLIDRILGPSDASEKTTLNIHEVLEHIRLLVLAESPEGIVITQDYDPSLPDVIADRDQLIQAELNILQNAVMAIAGEGNITLRTRAERNFIISNQFHKLVLRIDIIDDGPGIPAALRETLFYPMVTGRAEGTGLGLSIAQTLIHRQNGSLDFTSEPGHTCFTTWLPLENNK